MSNRRENEKRSRPGPDRECENKSILRCLEEKRAVAGKEKASSGET